MVMDKNIENLHRIMLKITTASVLMRSTRYIEKIDEFMNKYPSKKYFATGDRDQLQPINISANNVMNHQLYMLNCMNQLFPTQITLKINKRLKTDEQRNKLNQLKADILDKKK